MNENVEISVEGKTLYIGTECSSGCKYKFKNKEELKQLIHDYIDNLIDYEMRN